MYYFELGYDLYDAYIDGPEWKEIKDIFFQSGTPYRCRLCHETKHLNVHKRSYAYLEPAFFRKIVRNKKLLRKILVYLCKRCNTLVHFYKKNQKVPLDYLFLYDRELRLYWRVDMVLYRTVRTTRRVVLWLWYSYQVKQKRRSLY